MVEAVESGDMAETVECDTRLHGVLIAVGGRTRLAEPGIPSTARWAP